MGILSCCFGRQKVKEEEVLLPWAPLPADLQVSAPDGQRRGWRQTSQRSGVAPAFGEGALREDEWAPQFTRPYKKRSGRYGYGSLDAVVPPAATKPRPPSPSTAAPVPAPRAPSPAPASRAPFATAPAAQQAQGQPAGGWGSEPEWLREAALASAADTAAASSKAARGAGRSTKLVHLFSRDRGGENSSNSASSGAAPPKRQARKAAASPQRQRGSGGHDKPLRAPAFGESALTKWH